MSDICFEVSDQELRDAIELRMSDHFPAMNIANAMAGSQTPKWELARKYRLPLLVAEALDRGLPVGTFKDTLNGFTFCECKSYARVEQEIGGRADFPRKNSSVAGVVAEEG